MTSPTSNKHQSSRSRTLKAGLAGLITLTGLVLVAHGLWVPVKAQLAQLLLGQAWETSLKTGRPQKAWSWADSWPVAKLSIPAIQLDSIILQEAGGEGLAFGPVLLSQSAQPGSPGASVISAHRDTHFKSLKNIKIGDHLSLALMDGRVLRYQVTQSRIAPWDQSGLSAEGFEPELVLTSCWPFDAITPTDQRFILHAEQLLPQEAPTPQAALIQQVKE